jgi:hypothetical protein
MCRVSMYVRQRSGDNIVGDLGNAFFAPILIAAIPPSHTWILGRDERGWRNYEFQADRLGKEHIAHTHIDRIRKTQRHSANTQFELYKVLRKERQTRSLM